MKRPKATNAETATRIRQALFQHAVIPAIDMLQDELDITFTAISISFELNEFRGEGLTAHAQGLKMNGGHEA